MMIWLPLEKVADTAGSALAIHDRGPPGVAAPRHRFTLRLALPLHPVDYVRHQLLLLLSLLFPIRTFANLQQLLISSRKKLNINNNNNLTDSFEEDIKY